MAAYSGTRFDARAFNGCAHVLGQRSSGQKGYVRVPPEAVSFSPGTWD